MLKLRKLNARFLDVELGSVRQLRIRIVERPGRWMPAHELDNLVTDIRSIVATTVEAGTLDYGVVTGDAQRLENAVLTILYEKGTNRPVAFNALTLMPVVMRGREEEVLHIGLCIVDPAFRSMGLSWALYGLTVMLIFCHRQLRPLWISNVTQVPSVVGMVAESFDNVFPSPNGGARRSHSHLNLARQIMSRHRSVFGVGAEATFDFDRFIIGNSYTGGSDNLKKSYGETAKHRNESFNQMCREQLDYERGDDFLQIGMWTLGAAKRYLMRSIPRYSLTSILWHGVFLTIKGALIPVVHWFTPSRPFGELRACRR